MLYLPCTERGEQLVVGVDSWCVIETMNLGNDGYDAATAGRTGVQDVALSRVNCGGGGGGNFHC